MSASRTLTALLAGALTAAPLAGQGWTLDAYAGRATYDAVATATGARNAGVAARYRGPGAGWLFLSAAVPLSTGDPSWLAAGAGGRPRLDAGSWSLGLGLAGHGYVYRDAASPEVGGGAEGRGGTVEALPFVAFTSGGLRLEAASGVVHARWRWADSATSRTVHRSQARATIGGAARVGAEGRYLRVDGTGYPYAGVSAEVRLGRGRLWGAAGRWFSDRLGGGGEWRIGGALGVASRADVWGSIRRDATDPIYQTGPRRSWTLGLSWRPGRTAPIPEAMAPAVVGDGRLSIRLPLDAARGTPSVAGDFSGWEPVKMRRTDRGWVARFDVASGRYRFAFVDSNGRWYVPEAFPGRRPDGMGGYVAVIAVP